MRTSSRRLTKSLLFLAGTALLPVGNAHIPAFDLSEIRTIFSFGDSWTTTGYTPSEGIGDINQTTTTSAGPTWVQYLAWNHTSAGASYYDLAALGSTVDTDVVYANGATDFAGQAGEFLAYFNSTTSTVEWDSATALFTIWFGNDDIYNCFANGWNFIDVQPRMLTAFDEQVAKLYDAGARNFLLLSLPSLDRTPLAESISGASSTIQSALEFWNARLEIYAMFLEAKYADVQTKWFGARKWTAEILDDPSDHGFTNARTACAAYSGLGYEPNANDSTCGFSLSSFFWKDLWRPTWRVHEMMASAIATLLSSETPSLVLPSSASSAVFSSSATVNFSDISSATSSLSPSPSSVVLTSTAMATETSTSTVEPSATNTGGLRIGTNTNAAAGGAYDRRSGVTTVGMALAAVWWIAG
ncbi:hypothetical protein JCM8547_005657 [Rhodosporidiobolus lusitaniae]